MALPRATSSDADDLAATISGLKSRINELETASGSGNSPIGSIVDYIGEVAPSGWTLLDGTTIINGRFLYPGLWRILPASFKAGNNIVKPDTRGRVLVDQSATGTLSAAVGTTGGAEAVILTTNEMPSHSHGGGTGTAITTTNITVAGGAGTSFASNHVTGYSASPTATILSGSANMPGANHNHSISLEGGGQSHNNLQPYMIVLKIMKLA